MSPVFSYENSRDALRSALSALFVALAILMAGIGVEPSEGRAPVRDTAVAAAVFHASVSAPYASDHGSHDVAHSPGDCLHGQCAHSTALTSSAVVAGVGDFASTRIVSFQQDAPETRAPVPPARPPRA